MTDGFLDPPPTPMPREEPPARGSVVVVAPHHDDEVIGPGGTVLQHRALGDAVHVVVLTDGSSGDATGREDPAVYRGRREAECSAATQALGATVEFLGFPDGARAREEDLGVVVPRLVEAFERVQAKVVYAPHHGEVHRDHYVAAVAAARAAEVAGVPHAFGYEVWAPLVADCVVDITAEMPRKQEIARLYESQTAHTDILHFFTGLNAYRAVYLPKGARFGEAFRRLDG